MWTKGLLGLALLGGPLTLALAFAPRPADPEEALGGVNYHHISWPAKNPVWTFDWLGPDASSGVGHGRSGLELRQVKYKGKLVLYQAHVPVLNVLYDKPYYASCGPSYRDWQDQLSPFEANNVLAPGYAEPTVAPKTVYDHPGTQGPGKFSGVAVQKLADRLIMTTQMGAGWYRYIMQWTFHLNGTIEPRYAFTAVTNPCTSKQHHHHAYWRFDFDIDGLSNDVAEEYNPATKVWTPIKVETSTKRNATARKWRMRDLKTNRGFEIIPGAQDGIADAFAVADLWFLRYHGNEQNDGGVPYNLGGGSIASDRIQINKFDNNENIYGQDVVIWYRAGHVHAPPVTRIMVGPTLKPFGAW